MQGGIEFIIFALFATCVLMHTIYYDVIFIITKIGPIKFSPHYKYNYKSKIKNYEGNIQIIEWYRYLFFRMLVMLTIMINNLYFFEI